MIIIGIKTGRFVQISRTLASDERKAEVLKGLARSAPGRHIISVGFELEGGLDRGQPERIAKFVNRRGLGEYYEPGTEGRLHVMKYHSNLELRLWNTDLGVLENFLMYAYNRCGFETNLNCGFHVHMKFADMPVAVSFFSSPSIQAEFREIYRSSFDEVRYLDRLERKWCMGDNVQIHRLKEFIRSGTIPFIKDSTIALDSYKFHGTIEFRILPGQTSGEEAVRSLNWIVATADLIYERHGGVSADSILTPEMVEIDRTRHNVKNMSHSTFLQQIRW